MIADPTKLIPRFSGLLRAVGFWRGDRNVFDRLRSVDFWFAANKAPCVFIKRAEFLLNCKESLRNSSELKKL